MRIYNAKAAHFHYMKHIRGTYKWAFRRATINLKYSIRNLSSSISETASAIRIMSKL